MAQGATTEPEAPRGPQHEFAEARFAPRPPVVLAVAWLALVTQMVLAAHSVGVACLSLFGGLLVAHTTWRDACHVRLTSHGLWVRRLLRREQVWPWAEIRGASFVAGRLVVHVGDEYRTVGVCDADLLAARIHHVLSPEPPAAAGPAVREDELREWLALDEGESRVCRVSWMQRVAGPLAWLATGVVTGLLGMLCLAYTSILLGLLAFLLGCIPFAVGLTFFISGRVWSVDLETVLVVRPSGLLIDRPGQSRHVEWAEVIELVRPGRVVPTTDEQRLACLRYEGGEYHVPAQATGAEEALAAIQRVLDARAAGRRLPRLSPAAERGLSRPETTVSLDRGLSREE